jgi:hypothetical protein
MVFSLYSLLKAGLLLMNALAILHPQRFLRHHDLEQPDFNAGGGLKATISQTLAWTRGLRGACCFTARLQFFFAASPPLLRCVHPDPPPTPTHARFPAVFLIITNILVVVVEVLLG